MKFSSEGVQIASQCLFKCLFLSGEKTQRSIKMDAGCYFGVKLSIKCLDIVFMLFPVSLTNKPLHNHSFCKPLVRQVCKKQNGLCLSEATKPFLTLLQQA